MNDDLEKLAALLQEDVPPPRAEAKLAALQAGMAAFEKNSETFQGSPNAERLTNNRPQNGRGFLEGLRIMFEKLSPRGLMLGGASFATIALAIVVTQNVNFTGPAPLGIDANVPSQGSLGPADSETGYVPRPEPEAEGVGSPDTATTLIAPATESGDMGQIGKIAAGSEAQPANSPVTLTDEETSVGDDMRSEQDQVAETEALRERVVAAPEPNMSVAAPAAAPVVIGGIVDAQARSTLGLLQAQSDGIFAPQPENRDQFAGEAVSPIKVATDEPVS
ncbi:MAG TPA: hypothetical protein EYG79_11595, partial [Rhodobacteraceae bacterium]|nr:hypothetical protein [Paracoccaceae bacterium]